MDKVKKSRRSYTANNKLKAIKVRKTTHIGQKFPPGADHKLLDFQKIYQERKRHNFDLNLIINADLTSNVWYYSKYDVRYHWFEISEGTTAGLNKSHFSVMLACTASGCKLPPYVVFKHKTLPKNEKFPPGIIVNVQEKGLFDESD